MSNETELIQADAAHVIHSLHHPSAHQAPKVWVGGEGAMIHDINGRAYIDGLSGLWNVVVGHGREELAQAAYDQMRQLAYYSSYVGGTNLPAIQLAEKLAQRCYPSINTFFFTSGGAESSESSFKTARFYWKALGKPEKVKFISRMKGYHGVTLAAMSATGLPAYWPMFEPRVPGFVHIESPYPYRFVNPTPELSDGVAAANLLEAAILREGPETVAGFIAEPVQGAGGVIPPQDDYFARIREICDQYEVLFIADEVITGFGRTGRWFALEHYGVEPDIVLFAKAITSGYVPLGGIGVTDAIRDVIMSVPGDQRWMHAFTYSGHPTACAVALANLAIIEREGLVARAGEVGNYMLKALHELDELPAVGNVRGKGLMAAVELVADKASKAPFPASEQVGLRVQQELTKRGLFTRIIGDTICLAPPFVIPTETVDQLVQIIGDAVVEVT
ncbi:aminotransferase family protein [Candidatus Viridilinea mediisalina]|uniref:Aspartate aminotransferase family protein n=1 Tax=Candidatus Viridilinea mediisalina TaxID=2024553 RepID=A0A2A6RFQ5_9CHLR|nr:aspartate aminotransferase family protein [Candidatus Viridilinea mediisalina]PDW01852.1 aspartate aminotransferase family protein [Candidatus Viridilinea mediisalina]